MMRNRGTRTVADVAEDLGVGTNLQLEIPARVSANEGVSDQEAGSERRRYRSPLRLLLSTCAGFRPTRAALFRAVDPLSRRDPFWCRGDYARWTRRPRVRRGRERVRGVDREPGLGDQGRLPGPAFRVGGGVRLLLERIARATYRCGTMPEERANENVGVDRFAQGVVRSRRPSS
jgi:hypothetical protein